MLSKPQNPSTSFLRQSRLITSAKAKRQAPVITAFGNSCSCKKSFIGRFQRCCRARSNSVCHPDTIASALHGSEPQPYRAWASPGLGQLVGANIGILGCSDKSITVSQKRQNKEPSYLSLVIGHECNKLLEALNPKPHTVRV